MSIWKIAWRSIQQRGLASSLTGLSMALGVMLVVAVLVIHGVINKSFLNNTAWATTSWWGPRGAGSTWCSTRSITWPGPSRTFPTPTTRIHRGKYSQHVDKAIPLCLGDTYQEFRVVGTTSGFFNKLDYGGNKYSLPRAAISSRTNSLARWSAPPWRGKRA